jgi:hypothetical protein
VRKEERLLLYALFAIAFLLLVPALIEGPQDSSVPAMERHLTLVLLNTSRALEHQAGNQGSPDRVDRPESIVTADFRMMARPAVKADANGHPLGENTYIRAVYQAFRLEEKSG